MMKLRVILFILAVGLIAACNQQGGKTTTGEAEDLSSVDAISVLIAEDSTDGGLYQQRAMIYLEEGNHNMAMRDMLQAIQLEPENPSYMLTLSDIYMSMGLIENCEESLNRALQLEPENVESMLKLAEINLIMQKHQKAIEYSDMAIDVEKSNPLPYFIKAYTYAEYGDTVNAIRNYLEAIDKNQSYYDAYLQLGLIYSTANNPLAIDYFNNALNIEPTSIEALYALGLYYQQVGDAENAMASYNRLLVVDPENIFGHYNLGYVNLVLLNEYEQAIVHFDQAALLMPTYYEAIFNKGYCYELLGQYNQARELYNRVLEIEVNYARAIEGLNRIQGQ